ncbi:hypothetical protein BJ741DRAFT_616571 [Chytriomyces cf. hyalinus JEL632]|nr:hypothetical protein BJ741DRAFT_616571 [Chytriomyces cf. hyalinus JEL632]
MEKPNLSIDVVSVLSAPLFAAEDPEALAKLERPSLGVCLSSDVASGLATSLVVAPIVAIIDKSIISSSSGRSTLSNSLKDGVYTLFRHPLKFLGKRSFIAVYAIFAGTYTANNTVETLCINNNTSPITPKFLIGSSVNVTLCAWKDALYTKWYATVAPKPLPRVSYALFGMRDTMTVTTSFILPPLVSPLLQAEPFRLPKKTADTVCQFALPCLVQFASAPIHLLSLDLYNNPNSTRVQRMQGIRSKYWGCATLRVFRTLPGFGFGGVLNRHARVYLNDVFSPWFDGYRRGANVKKAI